MTDLPGIPRPRSDADRQAAWRERQLDAGRVRITIWLDGDAAAKADALAIDDDSSLGAMIQGLIVRAHRRRFRL